MTEWEIWCQCGDLMTPPDEEDKFEKQYGKCFECFGCDRKIYVALSKHGDNFSNPLQ